MLYVYTHTQQILVYHRRASVLVHDGIISLRRAVRTSSIDDDDILPPLRTHTHFSNERGMHESSHVSKKQICLRFLSLSARQLLDKWGEREMLAVIVRLFPFDQDATSSRVDVE